MYITRKLLFLPAFLLLACDKDDSNDVAPSAVPEAVKTSFATRFPTATGLEWEKQGDDYEADFEVNRVDYEALLNASGTVLKYKHDIPNAELPAAVQAAISQNHSGLTIDDAERLYQGASGETAFYQVELENGNNDRHLVYSADGQEVTQPAYWH